MSQLTQITQYMHQALATDHSGHSVDHIDRVVSLANKILAQEPTADPFIVQAAALLHDVYDDKLFETPAEAVPAKKMLADFLTSIAVTPDAQAQIFHIIDNMSWSKHLAGQAAPLDINGQIVQDADRLEAIGAIAIARTITYGAVKNRVLYDPAIPPRTIHDKTQYRQTDGTTINHFYEKLLLIKDHLNTATARQIAESRHQFMRDFLAQFKAEWALTK